MRGNGASRCASPTGGRWRRWPGSRGCRAAGSCRCALRADFKTTGWAESNDATCRRVHRRPFWGTPPELLAAPLAASMSHSGLPPRFRSGDRSGKRRERHERDDQPRAGVSGVLTFGVDGVPQLAFGLRHGSVALPKVCWRPEPCRMNRGRPITASISIRRPPPAVGRAGDRLPVPQP
jgi:hypothetical protein